jgi:transcriptional regulator with XRE-family HTH domain
MKKRPKFLNLGDGGVGSVLCKLRKRTYNPDMFPGLDDYIRDNFIEEKTLFAAAGAASQSQTFMGAAMSATGDMARRAIKSTFARSAKECVPREIPEEEADETANEVLEEVTCFDVCAPMPERKLEDVVDNLEKSFMEMVFSFADQKGLSDAQLQKRANIDRKAFSKLRCGTTKNPSKSTALALTIALELNPDDAKDLLARAGYALSPCSKQDVIVKYFIERNAYDIDAVNYALYEHGEPILGTK